MTRKRSKEGVMTRHRIALAGLALLTFAVPVTAQQSAGDVEPLLSAGEYDL